MATTTAIARSNPKLLDLLGEKYHLDPLKFYDTVVATIFPKDSKPTQEQVMMFLIVANKYDLNPFTREIYAFVGRGGGIVPIIPIDGWVSVIQRQEQFSGFEFEDKFDNAGKLVSITCHQYRKDWQKPGTVTEYMGECRRDTEPWTKWPARMLRHKAMIQCARYTFGLSGIYDEDEAERMEEASVVPDGRVELETGSQLKDQPKGQPENIAQGPLLTYKVGKKSTVILGNVTRILPDLKRMNGKPNAETNFWEIPSSMTFDFVDACKKHGIETRESPAEVKPTTEHDEQDQRTMADLYPS